MQQETKPDNLTQVCDHSVTIHKSHITNKQSAESHINDLAV